MKYVVFKKGEVVCPVIFSDFINHSDIKIPQEGFVIVSAGFCHVEGLEMRVAVQGSVSLDIGPNGPVDEKYLTRLMNGCRDTGTFFMDYDNEDYPDNKPFKSNWNA